MSENAPNPPALPELAAETDLLADALDAPDEPLNPEQAVLPSVAFAQHVDAVREHGDVLDNAPAYKQFGARERWMIVAGAVSGLVVGPILSNPIGWLGFAISGNTIADRRLKKLSAAYKPEAEAALSLDTCQVVGQTYELYSYKDKSGPQIDLRWYGPTSSNEMNHDQAVTGLKHIATLGQENKVATIAIGEDVLRQLHLQCPTDGVKIATWQAQLKQKKQIGTTGYTQKDTVLLATPEEWIAIVQDLKESAIVKERIKPLLAILSETDPYHPILRAQRAFEAEVQRQKDKQDRLGDVQGEEQESSKYTLIDALRTPARIAVESGLHNTIGISNRAALLPTKADAYAEDDTFGQDSTTHAHLEDVALTRKVSTTGKMAGGMVNWLLPDGDTQDSDPVFDSLQISPDSIMFHLDNPKVDPLKTVKTLELLLHNAIHGYHDYAKELTDRNRSGGTFPFKPSVMSQQLLTFTREVPGGATLEADALNKKRGLRMLAIYAATGLSLLSVREHVSDGVKSIIQYFGGYEQSGTIQGSFGGGMSDENEAPRTLYALESYGLDTAGYWTQQTSHEIKTSGDPAEALWMPDWTVYSQEAVPLPAIQPESQPYIEVKRSVAAADMNADNIVRVPVRRGTQPGGARYGDATVGIMYFTDGTYGFKLPSNEEKELTYWLIESADMVHATQVVTATGSIALDSEKVQSDWVKRIPNLSSDVFERERQISAYIKNGYEYALSPLPEGLDKNTRYWSQAIQQGDEAKKADCEKGNSANILSSPTVLNLALGFSNRNADNLLIDREAHAWGVLGGWGSISDATPSSTAYDAYFNAVPDSQRPIPYLPFGLVTGAALSGLAYRCRWRIRYTLEQWVDRPSDKLRNNDVDVLNRSSVIIDELFHAPPDRNDHQIVASALKRYAGSDNLASSIDRQSHAALRKLYLTPNRNSSRRLKPLANDFPEAKVALGLMKLIRSDMRRTSFEDMLNPKTRKQRGPLKLSQLGQLWDPQKLKVVESATGSSVSVIE